LRFTYTGLRGGELTNFVNFEEIGSYIVINFDTHLKGIPYWYEKLDFLFMSPFRIWLWIIPWMRGFFSVTTAIIGGIESFLEEKGLLTDEMKNIIYNQLVYNNYGNQVSVSGSGHTVNNIAQSAVKFAK